MAEQDRRIFVEQNARANEGWAKVFGLLFVGIMAFAIADYALTSAWMIARSWF